MRVFTFTPQAFVVLDKLVLTVGNENMMYSLLPSEWCKNTRIEVQDRLPTFRKKPPTQPQKPSLYHYMNS